jgi:hypothetical protein
MQKQWFFSPAAAFLCSAYLLTPVFCFADITVVSEVTISGQPAAPSSAPKDNTGNNSEENRPALPAAPKVENSTRTVTVFYKDKKARKEVTGGSVTIYDGDAGKVYQLDGLSKTYTETSLKDAMEARGGGRGPKMEGKAEVKAVKDAEGKQLMGLVAARYEATGSNKMVSPSESISGGGFSRGSGRGGGGGGFPGGGFPGGGGGRGFPRTGGGFPEGGGGGRGQGGPPSGNNRGRGAASTEMTGEFWVTTALTMPEKTNVSLLPTVSTELGDWGGAMTKPITEHLAKTKGFPLSSSVSFSVKSPNTTEAMVITTTSEVKLISKDTLADDLFRIPSDYKKAEKPDETGRKDR